VLPLRVITASLSLVSDQSESLVPFSLSFFSLPAAAFVHSLSKSSHNVTTQSYPRRHQSNHFHLFPHPVNIQRTGTPANPFRSIAYFTILWTPRGWGTCAPLPPRSHSTPGAELAPSHPVTPLDATFTRIKGATPRPTPAPCSPPTTHSPNQSATLCL